MALVEQCLKLARRADNLKSGTVRTASSTVWLEFNIYQSIYCTVVNIVPAATVDFRFDLVVLDLTDVDQNWRIENQPSR